MPGDACEAVFGLRLVEYIVCMDGAEGGGAAKAVHHSQAKALRRHHFGENDGHALFIQAAQHVKEAVCYLLGMIDRADIMRVELPQGVHVLGKAHHACAVSLCNGMVAQCLKGGEHVGFIAPVVVMPGENEMEAMALGGIRLLSGHEQPNIYHLPTEEGTIQ